MRRLLLTLLIVLPASASAQALATLEGRVSDGQGDPLAGVSVFVPGTLAAAFTGDDGSYRLEEVPVGEAEVHFSLAGYRVHVARVRLAPDAVERLDVTLGRRPFWERARLFSTDPDGQAAPFAFDRTLETGGLPARNVGEAAGLLPGLVRDERSDTLVFLGGTRVARALDGVPLPAPMPLPWPAIRQIALYGEHTPAPLAGGRDALLDVTTHDGSERQLFAEALASPLGPAGLMELRGAAGAPLLGGRARVFVAGSLARQDDPAPSAVPLLQLKSDVLARLASQPQEIAVVRAGHPADVRFLPLPPNLPDTISLADLRARLDVPEGYELAPQLRSAAEGLSTADFEETRRRRNASAETRSLLVRAGATAAAFDLDFTYADAADARDVWRLPQALFRAGAFGRTETRQRFVRGDVGRALGPLALRFTAAGYRDRATTYDPRFPRGIESTIRYGDLSEAAGATARAYRRFDQNGNVLFPVYSSGALPEADGVAGSFALLGAAGADYAHEETDARFLRLESSAAGRGHALTLGVERLRRVRRAIALPRTERLAGAPGDPAYQNLLPLHVGSIYYGYDYLGLGEADDEDVHAFAGQAGCAARDAGACRASRRIAPLEVTRWGFYAADRFGVGPLHFDLGLRYDRFGHNRLALFDPYARGRIVRARDVEGVPAGVAPDDAVYFSGDEIVGFRSRDGRFFDAAGRRVEAQDLPGSARHRLLPGATGFMDEADVLVASAGHGVWQPRAALSLAVAPQASVWLSFNRTADLPDDAAFNATLLDYERLDGVLPGAALRPEVATTYAAGGQASLGRARLALSLSQRRIDHVAVPHTRVRAFPDAFDTFASEGRLRVRSLGVRVAVARTRGLALEASYTLSRARGRPPLADALPPIFRAPSASTTTRHTFVARADYRTEAGEGPRVAGRAPFARLHVGLAVEAWSGAAYTRLSRPAPLHQPVRSAGSAGYGTLPWTALVHLQAERRFTVRGRELAVFAQVRNLFDAAGVRRVYGATGLPGRDGYLGTEAGQQAYPAGSIERFYYEARMVNPGHYGLPREIRLGLRIGL